MTIRKTSFFLTDTHRAKLESISKVRSITKKKFIELAIDEGHRDLDFHIALKEMTKVVDALREEMRQSNAALRMQLTSEMGARYDEFEQGLSKSLANELDRNLAKMKEIMKASQGSGSAAPKGKFEQLRKD